MKILIACEYSGIVRDAFTVIGHDATSCDLLPTESPGKHIEDNVLKHLNEDWDLMIAHPPCTYLSYAANKYFSTRGRAKKRIDALNFFRKLWEAPIEKICIENPLGMADAIIAKHSQIIHPYYFGEPHLKKTCLWLKNLPKLQYLHNDTLFEKKTAIEKPEPIYTDANGKKRYFVDATGGYHGEGNSFKKRSKTFTSIAKAMSEQWG